MAISIINRSGFSMSLDPLWIRFLTDNYLIASGVAAVYRLGIPNGVALGSAFDLIINQKRYHFVCAASPNGNGYEFHTYSTSPGLTTVKGDFEGNYYLNRYYSIATNYAGSELIFTAREDGADWNMAIENATGGITLTQTVLGEDATYRPNYKVFLDIHEQLDYAGAEETNLIVQLDADPHKDLISGALAADEFVVDFEFREILHSLLRPYLPAADEDEIKEATGVLLNYWIRYGEIYGNDPVVNWNGKVSGVGNYEQLLLGGWKLDDAYVTLALELADTKYMNRQPRTKIIKKSNPEYLFKYLAAAATDLQVHYKIYYTDGTTAAGKIGDTLTTLANHVYCVPSGWDILGLGAIAADKVAVTYEVYLTDSANAVLSETQTYILDYRGFEEEQVLLFLGAAGAMETVWLHGITQPKVKNMAEQYEKPRLPWYDKGDELLKHTQGTQNDVMVMNTGYKTRDYIEWLRDLANSGTVMMLDAGAWTSVRVNKDSIEDMPTGLDDLYMLSMEVERLVRV